MNNQRFANAFFALLLLVAVALACSLGDETKKANELVSAGNAAVEEFKKAATDAEEKKEKMLAAIDNLKTDDENIKAEFEKVKVIAKDSVDGYTTAQTKCKEVSSKYDEASKLKLNDKFKEYLSAKVKEWNKRAEVVEAAKGIPQALLDSKNHEGFMSAARIAKDKMEKLDKEATDLREQADKIQKDNPTVIKSS
jgi:hypothetical protein